MKKGLLALGASFALCLSMLATDMVVKQKNGEDWKINVDDVEEVFFEENAIIPEASTVVDASETFLLFNILSDSTAEVIRDDSGDERSYLGHDSITIPEKVRIGGNVYAVTSIGEYAFNHCYSLTSIKIPDGVTKIGDFAFEGCSCLTRFDIPEKVTNIGTGAFSGCNSLEPRLWVYDNGTKCYGWIGDREKCTEVVIPEGVTSIGAGAFSSCSLTSINIPKGVTSIGYSAFRECKSLKSITIPESVTSIGSYAFRQCYSLDVVIDNSEGNIEIGKDAFRNCNSVTYLK